MCSNPFIIFIFIIYGFHPKKKNDNEHPFLKNEDVTPRNGCYPTKSLCCVFEQMCWSSLKKSLCCWKEWSFPKEIVLNCPQEMILLRNGLFMGEMYCLVNCLQKWFCLTKWQVVDLLQNAHSHIPSLGMLDFISKFAIFTNNYQIMWTKNYGW